MNRLALLITLALPALALIGCAQRPPEQKAVRQIAIASANFSDQDAFDWQAADPAGHPVHGIDLSRFQTDVDWPTARANGVNFAFIKATEGGDQLDPMFATHWQGAGAAGVPRGAYHFFYHCRPADEQARWFIAHVPKTRGALAPVLDMEWTPRSPTCRDRRDAATIRSEARVFLDLLQQHYGQRPILYTSIDFYQNNALWRIKGTEFWLRSTAAHPSELYDGQGWAFWQYSGTGLVPGITGRVDLNVFAGGAASWADWLARRSQS